MKAMEKPETIIFLWFVAFAILLFILTLKFQNYSVDIRTTTSALLTTPFAIWALINIIKTSQLQTEKYLSTKWDEEELKTIHNN
jgi:hypothetical protein